MIFISFSFSIAVARISSAMLNKMGRANILALIDLLLCLFVLHVALVKCLFKSSLGKKMWSLLSYYGVSMALYVFCLQAFVRYLFCKYSLSLHLISPHSCSSIFYRSEVSTFPGFDSPPQSVCFGSFFRILM